MNKYIVAVAATILLFAIVTATATAVVTQQAYAQQNSQACPDGFTLSKGMCSKPADETTVTSSPTCPENEPGSFDQWELTQDQTKCFRSELIFTGYFVFIADPGVDTDEECQQQGSNAAATYDGPDANTCRVPSYTVSEVYVDSIPGETTTTYSCTQGTLNGDVCTVKPGNNRN